MSFRSHPSRRSTLISAQKHPDQKLVDKLLEEYPDEDVVYHCWVKKVNKRETKQDRLLVVGSSRIFTLKAGVWSTGGVARAGHIYDITHVQSPDGKELTITWPTFKVCCTAPDADGIICCVLDVLYMLSWSNDSIDVKAPSERVRSYEPPPLAMQTRFLGVFQQRCRYLGASPPPELTQMLEASAVHSINLTAEWGEGVVHALLYALAGVKTLRRVRVEEGDCLGKEGLGRLAEMVRLNGEVEALEVKNVREHWQWTELLGEELVRVDKPKFRTLSLLNVPLSAKGARSLSEAIRRMRLTHLSLVGCELSAEEIQCIGEAVCKSAVLEILSVSNNPTLGAGAATNSLAEIVSSCSGLRELRVRQTAVDLIELLAVAGRAAHLRVLDVSKTALSDQAKDMLSRLLEETAVLEHLDVSSCGLDFHYLSSLLRVVNDNERIGAFELRAAANAVQHEELARFNDTLRCLRNIRSLDLSDCGLGDDALQSIFEVLQENDSFAFLDLSYNLTATSNYDSNKLREHTATALRGLLAASRTLQVVALRGRAEQQFGPRLADALAGLEGNTTLRILDISGNAAYGPGLPAALTLGRGLVSLLVDGNHLPVEEYLSLCAAVEERGQFVHISPPLLDAGEGRGEDQWLAVEMRLQAIARRAQNGTVGAAAEDLQRRVHERVRSALVAGSPEAVALMPALELLLASLAAKAGNAAVYGKERSCLRLAEVIDEEGDACRRFFGNELLSCLARFRSNFARFRRLSAGEVSLFAASFAFS